MTICTKRNKQIKGEGAERETKQNKPKKKNTNRKKDENHESVALKGK